MVIDVDTKLDANVYRYLKERGITLAEFNYHDYIGFVTYAPPAPYSPSPTHSPSPTALAMRQERARAEELAFRAEVKRRPYQCQKCKAVATDVNARLTRYCRRCDKYDAHHQYATDRFDGGDTVLSSLQTIVTRLAALGDERVNLILDRLEK
jgi:hypothetical protein